MKKKLLYPGSSDTFENRQAVKATLASINAKTHKLLEAAGRQTPVLSPWLYLRLRLICSFKAAKTGSRTEEQRYVFAL